MGAGYLVVGTDRPDVDQVQDVRPDQPGLAVMRTVPASDDLSLPYCDSSAFAPLPARFRAKRAPFVFGTRESRLARKD